jgi:hypothetical protein
LNANASEQSEEEGADAAVYEAMGFGFRR